MPTLIPLFLKYDELLSEIIIIILFVKARRCGIEWLTNTMEEKRIHVAYKLVTWLSKFTDMMIFFGLERRKIEHHVLVCVWIFQRILLWIFDSVKWGKNQHTRASRPIMEPKLRNNWMRGWRVHIQWFEFDFNDPVTYFVEHIVAIAFSTFSAFQFSSDTVALPFSLFLKICENNTLLHR